MKTSNNELLCRNLKNSYTSRRVVKGNTEFPLRGDSEAPKGCNPMDKLDFMSNLKQYMHLVKLQSKINTDALFGEIDEVTERKVN